MAIRGLWLISHEKGGIGVVRFSRRYPTVEKRAKAFNGDSYVTIPEDDLFLPALLTELGLTDPDKNFVEYRDSCSRINKTSVYALPVGEGNLWPVLAIPNKDLVYVCVPLVEQSMNPLPPLITISGISEAFTFLAGLMGFINSGQKNETDLCAKVAQLPVLLTQACPLGSPTDSNLQGLLDSNMGGPGNQIQKQPAWKTSKYKGKAQVKVCISEKVKCMQYDKRDITDMWQVHGTVTCKCDLEEAMPHVIVSLNLPANGSPLQDILVHPCVASLDSAVLTSSSVDLTDDSAFSGPYKFPFTPPLDWFNLCYYTSQVPVPPILGFYQLQEEELKLKITVNLKLHESVKNGFEYCEARIPFFNRGSITHFEHKLSYGQLEVLREKGVLVWVIGQKFPKSLEISLTGTVIFGSMSHLQQPSNPICTGNTAYVKLYFRIPDYTLSGCYTDQHSVQVFSSAKPKIITSRELISSDYYIWNSKASAPVVYRSPFL
ncbi:AP-5 complex subunit mu-1 isoform X1 [Microcaecilia unicolor]|uniref:AP-5 complex subunit mu-1 n=1 Tax=Microcaecilia unicolor TaxID=1415580 RepID=A0A6P7Z5I0_9AMPH|nr:AP-5 complex subunit mu-1 isoform X1 [Microcaecilia unicolor]